MSMQDITADMLTRIRNSLAVGHSSVRVTFSKYNLAIAQLLSQQGYLRDVQVLGYKNIEIQLKYYKGKPVIEKLEIVSKPSRRIYVQVDSLPKVYNGFGIAVISTSRGLLTDKEARAQRLGGEVVCYVA